MATLQIPTRTSKYQNIHSQRGIFNPINIKSEVQTVVTTNHKKGKRPFRYL